MAALGGVHPRTVPNQTDGTIALAAIEAAVNPVDDHYPTTRLVCLENTHNRCGGAALSAAYTRQVADLAHARGLRLHLDGAPFKPPWPPGPPPRNWPLRTGDFCLSKALCAPVGSVLCGEAGFIRKARRVRKQLGGGMRQAGVIAAAGIVALETMTERLGEDHARAGALAGALKKIPGVSLEADPPPTNMVYLALAPEVPLDGAALERALARDGILIHAVGPRRIRLVLHYWIDDEGVERTAAAFRRALAGGGR
jgi:threonine aldolase